MHEGRIAHFPELQNLNCYRSLKDTKRLERSIGTLGGGNHFIEVDTDDDGNKYLIIHTGSRNLGLQVADYYQELAYEILRGKDEILEEQKRIIAEYKAAGRRNEIESALKALHGGFRAREIATPKELWYLRGEYRQMYLYDMRICQKFASLNRLTIADQIINHLTGGSLGEYGSFETVHNYVDHDSNIIRKGAVSAREGEKILIPINMRDGSIICVGKGNPDWNYSAPHVAGRLYSRTAAKEIFTIGEFEKEMNGIFTTSVSVDTIDECPMAYKTMDHIVDNISPTAEIKKVIMPLYNFKASE